MAVEEGVTFKKLEVFLAFMKTGNMARASETLGLSVVSVHRALHSLEDSVRCALFKPDGRKLIPLQTAYTLADCAERLVHECEEGVRKTREVAGIASPRLKIGALYSLTVGTIPQLIIKLKLRKSALDVDLTLGSNQLLLEQLHASRLDAVIVALRGKQSGGQLLAVPLFEDDIFFAAPIDSPYANAAGLDLASARSEKFVSLNEEFATAANFNDLFARAGFEPDIAVRVGDIFSLINLVSGGVGYSLLPGRVAAFSPRIQLIPLAPRYAASQAITLLYPRKRERDPNLLALAAECRMLRRELRQAGGPASGTARTTART